ncbi:hypothetical protein DL93DRAFT_1210458 [Clavulina sp. PMI_390]|nr:hypothetical protein DL93DRAFT_1210458 [Clavulina sp. PMI_390]
MEHLPVELIAEILVFGVESFNVYRPKESLQFRLAVSAVNATWRTISLSTPRLWSSITVLRYMRDEGSDLGQIYRWLSPIQAQIERSGNASLSIRVYTLRSLQPAIHALSNIILPVLWRCRYLEIQESHSALKELFPMQGPCPLLRELRIYLIWQGEERRAHSASSLFSYSSTTTSYPSPLSVWAPLLQKIVLTDVCKPSLLSSIPSSTLLDVTLRLPPTSEDIIIKWESLVNFFLPCANTLQYLSIKGPLPTLSPGDSPIIFKRLHSFTTDCINFPRYIVAPVPRFDDWVPSSLISQINELSVFDFGSEITQLLTKMALKGPLEQLFSSVRFLKLDLSDSFVGWDSDPKVASALLKLLQARPTLKSSVSEGILRPEAEMQIPAHVLDRILRIPED